MHTTIDYGKQHVACYRSYAAPLRGIQPIPESTFTGRDNILFAHDIGIQVFGDNFLAAYTEGDNRSVVATDTMKNVILQQALHYPGATLEGLLDWLGRYFLATYPQMEALCMTGSELPFAAASVPQNDGSFAPSQVLFSQSHNDRSVAMLHLERAPDAPETVLVRDHHCGRVGLQLMKVTGSSFADFVRDDNTTLPERNDRPLFVYIDVHWRYRDASQLLASDPAHYVPGEQVRDLMQTVFHRFVSKSIQHLLYEMGTRLLERFPQLAEVAFTGQNRLWDTAFVSEDNEQVNVYCDPRPPYGQIGLTLRREE
jgi:urate oxidase